MGEQLEIDVESDIAILAFAWKCECKKGLFFTREEFTKGMMALGVSTIAELRGCLDGLRTEIHSSPDTFRSFHRAAFKLSCEDRQKTIPPEVAASLLQLVVADKSKFPHMDDF